jgi:hypothetical protein
MSFSRRSSKMLALLPVPLLPPAGSGAIVSACHSAHTLHFHFPTTFTLGPFVSQNLPRLFSSGNAGRFSDLQICGPPLHLGASNSGLSSRCLSCLRASTAASVRARGAWAGRNGPGGTTLFLNRDFLPSGAGLLANKAGISGVSSGRINKPVQTWNFCMACFSRRLP